MGRRDTELSAHGTARGSRNVEKMTFPASIQERWRVLCSFPQLSRCRYPFQGQFQALLTRGFQNSGANSRQLRPGGLPRGIRNSRCRLQPPVGIHQRVRAVLQGTRGSLLCRLLRPCWVSSAVLSFAHVPMLCSLLKCARAGVTCVGKIVSRCDV